MGLLTTGDGNGCCSVLVCDVDICLISGSGGHKADEITIKLCIAGLFSLAELSVHPHVSSVVVNVYV